MTRKLKIAVYHNLHSGGALRALYDTLKWLVQDHQVDLYSLSCSEQSLFDMSSVAEKAYYYPFSPLPEFHKPFGRLNYAARYLDLFRIESIQKVVASDIDRRGYDVAFVHTCQFTQAPAVLRYIKTPTLYFCAEPLRVAYEPAVPRLYNLRGKGKAILDRLDFVQTLYRAKRKKIEQLAARSASQLVVYSYYSREVIYRVYGKDARVVYPGVDTEHFKPMDRIQREGVLSVGALTPLKGFDFVIRSLALIPATRRPTLTVASNYQEPAEKAYLEGLSRDLGVTLNLLQRISDELLVQLYNSNQVTVCASILEPFGLTPLESMACGTPVVAVAEGGLRESGIHGVTGFYVDRDPSQCAEAVDQLLTSPELSDCMGKNGRDHVVRNWGWEKSLQKLEKYLAECADLN